MRACIQQSILLWLIFLVATSVAAQEMQWQRTVRRRYPDTVCTALSMGEDRVAVAGTSFFLGGFQSHAFLMAFDGQGEQIWHQVYHVGEVDKTGAAAQDPDRGFYLAGTTWSGRDNNADQMLIHTNPGGDEIWKVTLGTPAPETGHAVCAVGRHGAVVAGTQQHPPPRGKDIRLVRVDEFGAQMWEKSYAESGDDTAWSILPALDGGFLVSGEKGATSRQPGEAFLLKTDAEGQRQWMRTYSIGSSSVARDAIACREGGYILTGSTRNQAGGHDVLVVRTDSAGQALWQRNFGGKYSDHGWCIRESMDGSFVVAGNTWTRGHQGSSDMLIMNIDPGGRHQWTRRFGGKAFDAGYSLTTVPGGWVAAGKTRSYGTGDGDIYVIRVNDDGASTRKSP